jgi:hypothetical protein
LFEFLKALSYASLLMVALEATPTQKEINES